ncbi:hypothetical protein THRCLA_11422 [Thraustotheca clavata]|uniref:Apple domain-containing protein n=1 Tax=Thraustotheca clavata TaxID=74557 RepID=A0A1V9Y7T4_9STRA|nr:hypothetical protein THRCLA_11422 [Thraustotheca clavata]
MCQPGNPPAQRNFVCTDHADFYGDDLSNTHTGYQGCVYNCRINPDCNAIAWVQDANGQQGMCYYKHLKDINRQPTSDSRAIKACKDTPTVTTAPPATQYVKERYYQLKGNVIDTIKTAKTIDECTAACTAKPGCAGVSFMGYYPQCQLQSSADNYFPVWSKAVDLQSYIAIPHQYKWCAGNFDKPNEGDVFNFQGSFQDCAKCMEGGKANAFAWWLGPQDGMAQPTNPKGSCYCKKFTTPVVPPPADYSEDHRGTIFCMN